MNLYDRINVFWVIVIQGAQTLYAVRRGIIIFQSYYEMDFVASIRIQKKLDSIWEQMELRVPEAGVFSGKPQQQPMREKRVDEKGHLRKQARWTPGKRPASLPAGGDFSDVSSLQWPSSNLDIKLSKLVWSIIYQKLQLKVKQSYWSIGSEFSKLFMLI